MKANAYVIQGRCVD